MKKIDVCIFTLTYLNKKNKHEQKCEVVVIRSAGLSTKQQQGFIHPVFTPPVDVDGMTKFFNIIIYYYYVVALWVACLRVLVAVWNRK